MQIIGLSEQHLVDAVGVLARAFHNQPSAIFYASDSQERMRLLDYHFTCRVKYCFARGEPYATAGKIEGVALWMPRRQRWPFSKSIKKLGKWAFRFRGQMVDAPTSSEHRPSSNERV